jgi:hypothetical protein
MRNDLPARISKKYKGLKYGPYLSLHGRTCQGETPGGRSAIHVGYVRFVIIGDSTAVIVSLKNVIAGVLEEMAHR